MKSIKLLALLLVATIGFYSCSSDDPVPVNDEEVITTMTVKLTPVGGGDAIELVSRDADGDGPNPAVITPANGATLAVNTTYNGVIKLENELETPSEDITLEVVKEADEHQFFYTISNGLNVTATATNKDGNGNPLGTQFSLATTTASSGSVTFTLRHEPKKPNTGLATAGGETDIAVTFNVAVQ